MRIANNPGGGPHLRGCVRGFQAWRQQQAEDRLTRPLVRSGPRGSGRFREAGWEEAVRLVAEGLARVRERHGDASILALGGSGSCRGALHDTDDLTAVDPAVTRSWRAPLPARNRAAALSRGAARELIGDGRRACAACLRSASARWRAPGRATGR